MSQSTVTLNPHLFFGGNCREAMVFYKQVFGGELTMSAFGDGPTNAHQDPKANSDEVKNLIMYAKLDGAIVLLASDNPYRSGPQSSGTFSLSLGGSDEAQLKAYFDKLSENGTITAPLIKQFWGDIFGMVTDQYGINWMITITNR